VVGEERARTPDKDVEIAIDLPARDPCHARECALIELGAVVEGKPVMALLKESTDST
jgi:hypothetical protein